MRLVLVALTGLCLLTGCWPISLKPLYTDGNTHFDPRFVGAWGDEEAVWAMSPVSGSDPGTPVVPENSESAEQPFAYSITYTAEGRSSQLRGWLTEINGVNFLDITPDTEYRNEAPGGEVLEVLLSVPAHTWLKIDVVDGKLELTPVDTEWLNQKLAQDPDALPFWSDETLASPLITASTEQLRSFIGAHMNEEGFFGQMTDLRFIGAFNDSSLKRAKVRSGSNTQYDSQYRSATPASKPLEKSP